MDVDEKSASITEKLKRIEELKVLRADIELQIAGLKGEVNAELKAALSGRKPRKPRAPKQLSLMK